MQVTSIEKNWEAGLTWHYGSVRRDLLNNYRMENIGDV
jgi:hypothetical protein